MPGISFCGKGAYYNCLYEESARAARCIKDEENGFSPEIIES